MPKKVDGTQAAIPRTCRRSRRTRNKAATISVPKNDPPKTLVDKVLIEGKGPEVKSGQTVYMQYSGATWKPNEGLPEAKLSDTSWKTGAPFSTPIGSGPGHRGLGQGPRRQEGRQPRPARDPAGQGYRTRPKAADIPANSTLVFVVDILGAM